MRKFYCSQCNKEICKHTKSGLCRHCVMVERWKSGNLYRDQTGKKNPYYKHGKSCVQHYCEVCGTDINWRSKFCSKHSQSSKHRNYCCIDCGNLITNVTALRGYGRCQKCSIKEIWTRPKYKNEHRKRLLKALLVYPNKPEKLLISLFKINKFNNLRYVGNGKKIINGLIPDFIDEKNNLIIELYGDYWHKRREVILRDKRRKQSYKKEGYKILIIWEKELKNISKVTSKIKKFYKLI